jgi:hypothetical protein
MFSPFNRQLNEGKISLLYCPVSIHQTTFNEVSSHLKSQSFHQSEVDPCVFFKTEHNKMTIVIVYVDDFFITAQSSMTAATHLLR